jgi:hypothetical protein
MACELMSLLDCIVVDLEHVFVLVRVLVNPQPCLSKGLQVAQYLLLPLHSGVVFSIMYNMQFKVACRSLGDIILISNRFDDILTRGRRGHIDLLTTHVVQPYLYDRFLHTCGTTQLVG